MSNIERKLINLKNMSSKEIWDYYVGVNEELRFISEFHCEPDNVYDIKEMCRIYAYEIPRENSFYTVNELEIIERGLYEHLSNYVESQGGMNKIGLIPEDVLDEMFEEEAEDLLSNIAAFLGVTDEEFGRMAKIECERIFEEKDKQDL
ncbi:MAG: hypothetical protein GX352_05210 [Clostridiales bacterium]|nr:hypothetical protein [Clostridiales bacterium]